MNWPQFDTPIEALKKGEDLVAGAVIPNPNASLQRLHVRFPNSVYLNMRYGAQPMSSVQVPTFEVRNSSGVRYGPFAGLDRFTMDFPLAGNLNPARARKGRVVFDVPKGQYDLYAGLGQSFMNAIRSSGKIAGVWELSPTESR
ncbi:MAG: hypothetical protein M3O30_10390 [Planctomycetota bacterium]|nr:hypothetical protein [Planctomycetota bacterium]